MSERHHHPSLANGPIKVTISDPATGDVLEEKIIDNDYVLICAGNRYLKSIQRMGTTYMLAVARAKE